MITPRSNAAIESGLRRPAGRPALRVLAFGLVLLGVCVFAWGLRYKLSLYAPPQSIAHRMPAAKLLAGKERLEFPAVHPRREANLAAPLALTILLLASFGLMRAGFRLSWSAWALRTQVRALAPQWARNTAIFVRPPPFIR